jgi:hypothetical protein
MIARKRIVDGTLITVTLMMYGGKSGLFARGSNGKTSHRKFYNAAYIASGAATPGRFDGVQ